jgi:hypothetical protein
MTITNLCNKWQETGSVLDPYKVSVIQKLIPADPGAHKFLSLDVTICPQQTCRSNRSSHEQQNLVSS